MEQAQRIDGPDAVTIERDESTEAVKLRDTKAKLLYKEKFGTVHVRIWGPTSGTRWKRIDYTGCVVKLRFFELAGDGRIRER